MKKIRCIPIMDRIYKSHFHLCYGGTSEDIIKYLTDYHGKIVGEDLKGLKAKGAMINLSNNYNYIWIGKGNEKEAVLIHELLHFTLWSLREAQIPVNKQNEDVACYYMEYLYEEIMKVWKKLTR